MPNTREKLVELKKVLRECLHFNYDEFSCDMSLDVDLTAENLFASGVTVQEWISVKDRMPEKYGRYIALTPGYLKGFDQNNAWLIYYNPQIGFYDTEPQWGDIPMDDVTHWMPLPQPPKGE